MLFAHLKRILGLGKLRPRGPSGAKDEFLLAAAGQNLRKLAKLIPSRRRSSPHEAERPGLASLNPPATHLTPPEESPSTKIRPSPTFLIGFSP
jgi:hypothetical protein